MFAFIAIISNGMMETGRIAQRCRRVVREELAQKILITPLKVESVMRMAISIEEIIVYVTCTLHARASHSLYDDLLLVLQQSECANVVC